MLRITSHNDATVTRLIIEGKLAGDYIRELEQCWLEALAAEPQRLVRIELADVTFIDEAGRLLLARMAANGAELKAVDLVARAIIDEVLGIPHVEVQLTETMKKGGRGPVVRDQGY